MSFSKNLLPQVLFFFILTSLSSCVKDIDLDQAEDISLRPKLLVDLLFFELNDEDFQNPDPNQQKVILRDTVRLEFLDDGYIQKDLMEVELNFKHTNSFPQDFVNTISFLSENNRQQHVIKLNVEAGKDNNPRETEKTELLKAEQLSGIKNSIKMVMEVEFLPNDEPLSGELKFESKGLFSFEF